MRRILTVGLVAALATALLAAIAYAATVKDFGGPVKGGGATTFSATKSGGDFTKAGLFSFVRVPLNCSGGSSTLGSFSTNNSVNVSSRRKFSYVFHFSSGGTATVTGKFNQAGDKATGTFKASGVNFSTRTNCTTNGERDWRAETW
ncbi:MAG: hypothetical protein ACRDK1_10735 [Solirubrobacterales bacterium]